jgi:hypothetical protein
MRSFVELFIVLPAMHFLSAVIPSCFWGRMVIGVGRNPIRAKILPMYPDHPIRYINPGRRVTVPRCVICGDETAVGVRYCEYHEEYAPKKP